MKHNDNNVHIYAKQFFSHYNPIIAMNIDGPDNSPAFDVPSLGNCYLFVPTSAEINHAKERRVSLAQSCIYKEETREQSDTQEWHALRTQYKILNSIVYTNEILH